ncbi:MAG: GspE/PulE family protein [Deltaproteobacteria bacterium]|nr:GspE/PulE family protein [Deltaproteobacteria bacterium]MBW1949958.1 GspE/PulE family protein [Deltaproteobacteria bacterium]MBW2007903.1 GspE/PulE family protein [Deltaproteobacteria bacterium]
MEQPAAVPGDTGEATEKLLYYKALHDIANQIHAAKNLDEILISQRDNILTLFDADRITIYVVDSKKKEIYSRFKAGDVPKEIRLPIDSSSIAGYTALTAQITNIANAYDKAELALVNKDLTFDEHWDQQSGYQTRQILSVPIFYKKFVIGVLQLVNKKHGSRFTLEDQNSAVEMAKVLGIAFFNQTKLAKKARKKSRFDYLLSNNIITQKELQRAISLARGKGTSMEAIFIHEMKVKKADVGRSLAEYYNCRYVPFDDRFPIPTDALARLKPVYLRKNLWVPLAMKDGVLQVLIDNPQHLDKIDSIKALIPAERYEFAVGLKEDILQFLDYFYGSTTRTEEGSIDDILGKLETEVSEEPEDAADMLTEDDSTIVQLVNRIVTDGYKRNCSDIHIEPYPGKSGAEIRFRIDGYCHPYQTVPYQYKRAVVSRIKIMADLDISERRKPQDGKIKFKKFSPLDIELRVATIPTAGGEEDVVMRILAAGEPIALEKVGMSERDYGLFMEMIKKPYGIILVVGPTGSGKTTTLHSALSKINRPETKIWTAEDPVEITQRGLRQVQVQPKIGVNFAAAMRAFLRADPDVIMVGEMRDQETASTGIEASLTGHLVFSTLHTNSAPETIVRLLDMGMDPFNFSDALIGILAQRLVRTLCTECKEAYHPDREEYDALVRAYDGDFDALGFPFGDKLTLYRAKGCDRCNQSGYRGRAAIMELLSASDEIKALIQARANMDAIRKQAVAEGMTTLMQDGIRKIFLGLTDIKQVRRVCMR